MPVDLDKKVSHLIGDFRALINLINAIEHEFEKRIVARHGMVKIECLHSIIGAYKNQIRTSQSGYDPTAMAELEKLIGQLSNDVEAGIRKNRNYQSGHYLKLSLTEIPEQWLFLGKSTFEILWADLIDIEELLTTLDSQYTAHNSWLEPDRNIVHEWRDDSLLGPPDTSRLANVYAGPWTPDIGGPFPGDLLPRLSAFIS